MLTIPALQLGRVNWVAVAAPGFANSVRIIDCADHDPAIAPRIAVAGKPARSAWFVPVIGDAITVYPCASHAAPVKTAIANNAFATIATNAIA